MRDYGKVHASFWANEQLKALDVDARLLALYLMTSPHTHMSGAFRLPDAYAMDDLRWNAQQLRNAYETLSKIGFCKRCETTKWVWVCKFHAWNVPENPNVRKALIKHVEAMPLSVCFRDEVDAVWGVCERVSVTVTKPPYPSPSPSPSPSLSTLPLDDGTEFDPPASFVAELMSAYPKIDLQSEFGKMRVWLISSAANRKTRRGTPKFINSWLSRATPAQAIPAVKRRKQLGEGSSTNYSDTWQPSDDQQKQAAGGSQ